MAGPTFDKLRTAMCLQLLVWICRGIVQETLAENFGHVKKLFY